jgi:hypothetical protein
MSSPKEYEDYRDTKRVLRVFELMLKQSQRVAEEAESALDKLQTRKATGPWTSQASPGSFDDGECNLISRSMDAHC